MTSLSRNAPLRVHAPGALLLASLLAVACSSKEAPRAPAAVAGSGRTGTASIAGVVRYAGPPLQADRTAPRTPECSKGTPVPTLQLADGRIGHAFVYVREGLPLGAYPLPPQPVVLDQRGCEYEPRVFGVRAGQAISLVNGDNALHNVHALGLGGGNTFNVAMPLLGMKVQRRLESPQVMVTISCDVHPWMRAYAGVLEHPFFAVSAADGSFKIDGLPAGTYVVEAWQERLGKVSTQVVVQDGAQAAAELSFGR